MCAFNAMYLWKDALKVMHFIGNWFNLLMVYTLLVQFIHGANKLQLMNFIQVQSIHGTHLLVQSPHGTLHT